MIDFLKDIHQTSERNVCYLHRQARHTIVATYNLGETRDAQVCGELWILASALRILGTSATSITAGYIRTDGAGSNPVGLENLLLHRMPLLFPSPVTR